MKMIKRIVLTSISSTLIALFSTTAIAEFDNPTPAISNGTMNDDANVSIDISNIPVTRHEIALIDVLSEICPSLLEPQDHSGFANAYNILLNELLPTIENPQAALQYLSTQQDYQQVLESIRAWTMEYSDDENRALCQDMARSF